MAGVQFLAVALWAIGGVLCLFTPPHDVRARLVGLCWLGAAVVVLSDNPNGWVSLAMATAGMVAKSFTFPGFVLAHLYFPIPSLNARWRRRISWALVAVAVVLAALNVLEDWGLNPRRLSFSWLLGVNVAGVTQGLAIPAFLLVVGLLAWNTLRAQDPNVRRQTGIIMWGMALGIGPIVVAMLLDLVYPLVSVSHTIYFIILVPLSYAYVMYQRRLMHLDFIINRAVVLSVVILLILIASTLALNPVTAALDLPLGFALAGAALVALAALLSPGLHRAIQRGVDRVLYGYHYDFTSVTSTFSSRLARAIDREALVHLLREELPRQMGTRQTALFLARGHTLTRHPSDGEPDTIADRDELCQALLKSQKPARAETLWESLTPATCARWQGLAWAQIFAPVIFESQLQGLLVLGARISGDVYSDQDVQIIATVAQQTALAYTNVQLVETLRGLNRRLVRADETHRKCVARDLHDAVLQQLFFVKQGLFHDQAHSQSVALLDDIIEALRRTIRDERPPLLDQGLQLALQGLVEEMQKVAGASPAISWRSNIAGRLPLSDEQATALYRIAQEALANALKHAHAQHVAVTLDTDDGVVRLCVADDGVGAPARPEEREHHYGIAGMRERAAMIHAHLRIASAPGEGTHVTVEVRA
jgi:signal transduction histidine kinase